MNLDEIYRKMMLEASSRKESVILSVDEYHGLLALIRRLKAENDSLKIEKGTKQYDPKDR